MKLFLLFLILACLVVSLGGITLSIRDQVALTIARYLQDYPDKADLLAWWQPELNASQDLKHNFPISSQFSGTFTGEKGFHAHSESSDCKGRVYRLWLKVDNHQSEARLGLQKINFGSAQILRPLQWFDNLNPTDKLEQTTGVQALLLTHYFMNNANLWLWGIRGESKQQGQILTVTKKDTPELGGRLQYPLAHGEAALTYNHRQQTEISGIDTGSEDRLGFDTKLDLGPGLWMEGYLSRTEHPFGFARWQAPVTIGAENTFGLGNGIYTLVEIMFLSEADTALPDFQYQRVTFAGSVNYPLNILDRLIYFGIVNDNHTLSYHTLIWRREYDHLSWDLDFFWDSGTRHRLYNSRGIKLVLAYTF